MSKYFPQFIAIISCVILVIGFGIVFFPNRSFGAFGDDSPGYIYQATKYISGETHIEYDEIAQKAFTYFNDPEIIKTFIPRHSKPLNRDGMIASKYPIGAGWIMAGLGWITGSEQGFYLITPLCACGVLFLLFWISYLATESWPKPFRIGVSALSVALLGFSNIFYEYAISQPMRELPSMVLILAAFLLLLLAKKYPKRFWAWVISAAICYGLSLNVRHTGIVIAPAFILMFFDVLPKPTRSLRLITKTTVIFGLVALLFLTPSIINSVRISENSVSFETGDDTVVVASNFDHVESLSFSNIFHNNGRFRSGKGSLPHYMKTVADMTTIPLFLYALAVGIIIYIRKQKGIGASFAWAAISIIALFSLWVNPYSRYILPAFPFLIFFISLGIAHTIRWWMKLSERPTTRLMAGMLATLFLFILFVPHIEAAYLDWKEPRLINKSLTYDDFQTVLALRELIPEDNALLIMTGDYMYGLGEMIEGHTDIEHIRINPERIDIEDAGMFIENELLGTRPIYFWNDPTTDIPTRTYVMENWEMELVNTQAYSFVPLVEIWKVN